MQALLEGALLCNDSALTKDDSSGSTVYTPNGAPTEVSLITAALKAGLQPASVKDAKPRVTSVPFESEHKVRASRIEGQQVELLLLLHCPAPLPTISHSRG